MKSLTPFLSHSPHLQMVIHAASRSRSKRKNPALLFALSPWCRSDHEESGKPNAARPGHRRRRQGLTDGRHATRCRLHSHHGRPRFQRYRPTTDATAGRGSFSRSGLVSFTMHLNLVLTALWNLPSTLDVFHQVRCYQFPVHHLPWLSLATLSSLHHHNNSHSS